MSSEVTSVLLPSTPELVRVGVSRETTIPNSMNRDEIFRPSFIYYLAGLVEGTEVGPLMRKAIADELEQKKYWYSLHIQQFGSYSVVQLLVGSSENDKNR